MNARHPGNDRRIDKGVYMTNDMEKAARYAVEGTWGETKHPCILEIVLSGRQRTKKIYRDKLDRDENLLYDDAADVWENDVEDLKMDLQRVLDTSYLPGYLENPLDTYGDPSRLRGTNIYALLLRYARENKLDINEFKKKMFSEIPAGSYYGDFEIAQDGSIVITTQAYDNMHQQVYPKDIPPSAIKAVWMSKVPESVPGERITVQSKLLPQEVRHYANRVNGIAEEYTDLSEITMHEIGDFIDELEDLNAEWLLKDVLDKLLELQTQAKQIWDDAEDGEVNRSDSEYANKMEDIALKVSRIAENLMYESAEWTYDPPGGLTTEFTKMSPQEALSFVLQPAAAYA